MLEILRRPFPWFCEPAQRVVEDRGGKSRRSATLCCYGPWHAIALIENSGGGR